MSKKKQTSRIIIGLAIIVIGIIIIIYAFTNGFKKPNEEQTETIEQAKVDPIQYVLILDDGTKVNTNQNIVTTIKLGSLDFDNIRLTSDGTFATLTANITNTKNEQSDMKIVEVILYDSTKNEIGRMEGLANKLQAGETSKFTVMTTQEECINAYSIEIVEK